MRRWTTIGMIALVALLSTSVALASNSWNGYHWSSDNLSPTVVNNTSSSLYDVPAGVAEWAALGTPIQPAF